jgi:hypothetical protein
MGVSCEQAILEPLSSDTIGNDLYKPARQQYGLEGSFDVALTTKIRQPAKKLSIQTLTYHFTSLSWEPLDFPILDQEF